MYYPSKSSLETSSFNTCLLILMFSAHIPCLDRRVETMAGKTSSLKDAEWLKCLVLNMIGMQLDPSLLHTQQEDFLKNWGLETTLINTKGYETLLSLVENTMGDSYNLSSFSADCIVYTESSYLKMKNRSLLCQRGLCCQKNLKTVMYHHLFQKL
ncbi:hypothetical protein HN51_016371 [Arachis hypogaea]|uniref:TYRAAT2-like C-terminal domain-containing protein n=1 Tax=Arachis hypogaea TaxID=3818 RepID=A0A445CSK8_ARAHY|nr:hypothetical protein Ahy_A06g029112 [Arachis hypogaea]